jgi:repressor of nif and glnA expression
MRKRYIQNRLLEETVILSVLVDRSNISSLGIAYLCEQRGLKRCSRFIRYRVHEMIINELLLRDKHKHVFITDKGKRKLSFNRLIIEQLII